MLSFDVIKNNNYSKHITAPINHTRPSSVSIHKMAPLWAR